MKTIGWLTAAVCGIALVAGADELAVPLKVAELAGVDRVAAPVRGGVPVGPLGVKDVSALLLADDAGRPVAAQIRPLVADASGRLQWVLVDFSADLKAGQTRSYTLAAGGGGSEVVPRPVVVRQTADAVELSNGLTKVVLSKRRFDLFEQAWTDRDGDGRFADDERMLDANRPVALAIQRVADGKTFSTREGAVESVAFEDSGPVRTICRVDGTFAAGGEGWLKYTCRVTMIAGRPEVGVEFAIRNVNPAQAEEAHIKLARLTMKLVQPTGMIHYLLGGGRTRMSQLTADEKGAIKGSQWHDAVRLAQVGPCEPVCSKSHRRFHHLVDYADAGYRVYQSQPGSRAPIADVGFACGGWVDLAGDAGGCLVWLRNFTEDNPKQLEAKADGTVAFDLIPQYDGDGQPYYANGGYWLGDRSHKTFELAFLFHGRPLATEADWAKWRNEFQNYAEPTPATAAAVERIVTEVRFPLQLVSTAEWYTRTGQMWGVVPSLAEERAAAVAMGWQKVGPVRPVDIGGIGDDFIHYENFHYRSEWDEPRDQLLEFLRTGEQHFLRRAHSFADNYRDLGVWRTDGLDLSHRAEVRLAKSPAAIPRWGKFCDCHNYGVGLLDMWLATGDRSFRDAGMEWAYVQASDPHPYGGFGLRHWGRRMAQILRAWQLNGDPKLKAYLMANCRPRIPDEALRADGRCLVAGTHQASWMTALCTHAIWHHWIANGGELAEIDRDDYRDQMIGIARNVAKYWYFPQYNGGPYYITFDDPAPGQVSANGGGRAYTVSMIDTMTRGWLLTGDPRCLAMAKKFWDCANGQENAGVQSVRLQDVEGMGSSSFWARQLNYELAHPRTDAQPPAAVTDLAAEVLGGGKVKLTWTAPADAGGRVAFYQLKHAPCPMVSMWDYDFPADHGKKWTWWAGYNVAGEPAPAAAGAAQSLTVESIPAGVRWFALRATDDANNESPISNLARVEVK